MDTPFTPDLSSPALSLTRRSFITTALSAGLASAVPMGARAAQPSGPFYAPVATGEDQGPPIPQRRASTTPKFRVPHGYPNALGATPDGFWVAEQRFDSAPERLWLLDWDGHVQRTITSAAKDTSGVAFGDGKLWICADDTDNPGVFVTAPDGRSIEQRQIPLGPASKAGGCHGATWSDGHLWVTANRPRAILKIDPAAWTVDYLIPFGLPVGLTRYHGCAVLGDSMFMVSGDESKTYAEGGTNLIRYDLATGVIREIYDFAPGSCDPHGLMAHDGKLYGCDSGFHPGWKRHYDVAGLGLRTSPTAGWIFTIELG